ncbi:hypothetical protein H8S33_00020 [Ornithinibacillus sp. BX22]|uniref:Uncharacterized protein n=1 Tax=Ornithinibacillus hominis TaxID=2763055 RepID=A0A923RFP3_9BACI|nr:hypothetical protein [Ornithinibacillus hominis]MBC5635198.1 hypothetical protein [Ornithinibacillus hominis]
MKTKSLNIVLFLIILGAFLGLIGVGILILLSYVFHFDYDNILKLVLFIGVVFAGLLLVPVSLIAKAVIKEKANNSKLLLVFSEVIQFGLFLLFLINMNKLLSLLSFQNQQVELLFYLFIYAIVIGIEYFGDKK